MPVAMALLRDVHNLCPKEVLMFILDLIKYNDNRKNKVKNVFILISSISFFLLKKVLKLIYYVMYYATNVNT